jgi:tRNA A58 N-methylase Trm61
MGSYLVRRAALLSALLLVLPIAASSQTQAPAAPRTPDVIYVPTPPEVVSAMLKLANVTKNDVVYDLGCGDGRIVIAAAKEFGARGIGIDIDPQRIAEANENAKQAGVTDKVKFMQADLFESSFSEATVVTLYLLPSLNVKLRPKLWKELKPGTRIVSHSFDMGDWQAEKTIDVDGRKVYFWTIPPDAAKRAGTPGQP